MPVPRLGVKSELQLPAHTTAIAMLDPSRICSLYHRSWQTGSSDPLSKAGDQIHILMDTSQILNLLSHKGNSYRQFLCGICFTPTFKKCFSVQLHYHYYNIIIFCLFRAVPVAYGSSQARGRTRAAATGLYHSYSNTGSEPYPSHHSS